MDQAAKDAWRSVDKALSEGSFAEAMRLALPWADRGFGWAELCVGSLYQCGLGVPRDEVVAVEFLRRAAGRGYGGAWHALGVIYETGGGGVEQDPGRAQVCYRKAAELGYFPGKRVELDRPE